MKHWNSFTEVNCFFLIPLNSFNFLQLFRRILENPNSNTYRCTSFSLGAWQCFGSLGCLSVGVGIQRRNTIDPVRNCVETLCPLIGGWLVWPILINSPVRFLLQRKENEKATFLTEVSALCQFANETESNYLLERFVYTWMDWLKRTDTV